MDSTTLLGDEKRGFWVFITAGPITKLFAGGGGGEWRTCAMIDDEPSDEKRVTLFFFNRVSPSVVFLFQQGLSLCCFLLFCDEKRVTLFFFNRVSPSVVFLFQQGTSGRVPLLID